MLEVVSTSGSDEIRAVHMARDIGVDWVLGGTHVTEALGELAGSAIRYCPFPGTIVDPSVLIGDIEEIAASARALSSTDGVDGLDLLAYRHQNADAEALTRAVVDASAGPVIAAGSIQSQAQTRALARSGAWAFTVGSAIFEELFAGAPELAPQVQSVLQLAGQATAKT